jgi:hypothetical protein
MLACLLPVAAVHIPHLMVTFTSTCRHVPSNFIYCISHVVTFFGQNKVIAMTYGVTLIYTDRWTHRCDRSNRVHLSSMCCKRANNSTVYNNNMTVLVCS